MKTKKTKIWVTRDSDGFLRLWSEEAIFWKDGYWGWRGGGLLVSVGWRNCRGHRAVSKIIGLPRKGSRKVVEITVKEVKVNG